MPTEHEYKFVLSLDLSNSIDTLSLNAQRYAKIEQGYVVAVEGTTTRVRHIVTTQLWQLFAFPEEKWFLTFKKKVKDRQIEVEVELDERDGADLWEVCTRKVKKTRYYIDHKDVIWELDIFEDDRIYFVLVECELPEGTPRPQLPFFLQKYLLYEVALTDERFSNKNLGDVGYATNLYELVEKGVINDHSHSYQTTKEDLQPDPEQTGRTVFLSGQPQSPHP